MVTVSEKRARSWERGFLSRRTKAFVCMCSTPFSLTRPRCKKPTRRWTSEVIPPLAHKSPLIRPSVSRSKALWYSVNIGLENLFTLVISMAWHRDTANNFRLGTRGMLAAVKSQHFLGSLLEGIQDAQSMILICSLTVKCQTEWHLINNKNGDINFCVCVFIFYIPN